MLLDKQSFVRQITTLKALYAAGGSQSWVSAPAVIKIGGTDMDAGTVYRVLSSLRGKVRYRTNNGVRRFQLTMKGCAEVDSGYAPHTPTFIAPSTPWSTQRELQKFLGNNSKKFLFVIDPYVSEDTLDVLKDVTVPICILAIQLGRLGSEPAFLRQYKKFKKEKKGTVELRQCSRKDLHGRSLVAS